LLAALRWLVLCSLLGLGLCCRGGDWPQFRGPTHDGVSTEQINEQWTGSVTNPVWLVPVSNSLSGFAVSGGRAFTQINRNINSVDEDVCVAFSAATGAELWATVMEPANYPDGFVGYDEGPRTTPSFDGGSVFVLSSYLKLCRLNATNGAVIWQKDLLALYGGSVIRFQNAASPLIDNGLIYLNANCGTSTLMALRTSDGSVAWRSQDEAMTHSTPTLATIQGVRQLIFAVQSGLVSLDPQTGARLWHFNYPFTFNPRYSVATQPVVHQDMVFVSGCHCDSYGSVVRRITLTGTNWTTTQLWWTNNPAAPFMNPVAYQGYLYGQFGIQQYDNTNAQLKCIDMQTGQVKWSVNGFGRGGTLLVNNRLLIITETGTLVLAAPNPNAYTELGRCLAIPGYSNGDINKCWTAPAVSDGWVYVRSTSFGASFNFSVSKPPLTLDAPSPSPGHQFQLTVRTVNGTPLDSNRLAAMEVRASTNLSLSASGWPKLTNNLLLTNGVGRVLNVDGGPPRRYFIVREPQ